MCSAHANRTKIATSTCTQFLSPDRNP
jgi:hypothetical protein